MDAHVVTDRATREKLVKAASECFMKAFKSVLRMRSVEEDLDRAANSLLELGVQPFHLIRQGCTASEPEPKFNR